MRYRVLFLGVVVGLFVCTLSFANVPKMMNFQGRLTDASGKFVTDGNYSLTFRIYSDSTGGSAKWSEGQLIALSKGLFNVILGSVNPIPDSIFNYPNTYLGIQVGTDPEMTPRQRLSSLGYSYRTAKADTSSYSMNSDKLDGLHASDFSSPASDYGRSGVAADLYEGTSTLTSKYVNVSGSDSVYSASGTAFKGRVSGSSASPLYGLQGYGVNSSTGDAYGGYFETPSSGTGSHYGVMGRAYANSSNWQNIGVYGFGENTSTGGATGGYFITSTSGTGNNYGIAADGSASAALSVYGAYCTAHNLSSGHNVVGVEGDAYNSSSGTFTCGGEFFASGGTSGNHYGVLASVGAPSNSSIYGVYGNANNNNTGNSYGGYFISDSSGTGSQHYGAVGIGNSTSPSNFYTVGSFGYGHNSSTGATYGSYGYADNTSTGNTYGGYFATSSSGTGEHYGIYGNASASTSAFTYGTYGYASNSSDGSVHGGYFETSNAGTGEHYAVRTLAAGNGTGRSVGVWGQTYNTGNTESYGVFGWSDHYGTGSAYGVYGYVSNADNATAYGGCFSTPGAGSGKRYGVLAASAGTSDSSTYGVYGVALNSSTGHVYAGYFAADSIGSGTEYGVYAQASVVYWAGWFQGDLGVSHNLYVYGSKSSAVKVNTGEYRAFYSQESPENWFEDFGEGQLVNGRAHIELDPTFQQTVTINSLNPMKVFVQLEGDCNGVFVTKGTSGFDVTELKGGSSSVSFSYRVVAKRKGYENIRLAKMKGPSPEEMTLEQAKHQTEFAREEKQRQEERKRIEQERLEMQKDQEKMKPEPASFPIQSKK